MAVVDFGSAPAWVSVGLTAGAAVLVQVWAWAKFKTHSEEHNKMVCRRLTKLEEQVQINAGCLSKMKQEVPSVYLAKKDHDRLSETCTQHIFTVIDTHKEAIKELKKDIRDVKQTSQNTEIMVAKILERVESYG